MAKRKVAQGVREAVTALALDGATPKKEIARKFGLDVQTVRRMAAEVKDIDPVSVAALQRALPSLLQVLATAHAQQALEKIDDPNASVRHTFGAKLAVEAGRVAQPQAEAPGHTVLTFINQLKIHTAPQPEVIDAIAVREPEPPGGGADLAGAPPDALGGDPAADGPGGPAFDGSGFIGRLGAGDESEALLGELMAAPGGDGGAAGGRPDDAGAPGGTRDGGAA